MALLFQSSDRSAGSGGEPASSLEETSLPDAIGAALSSRHGLVRFSPDLSRRFERDTRGLRVHHLRRMIWLGVLVSNIYDIAGFVTLPHLAWLNVALRVGLLTPIALVVSLVVDKVEDRLREKLCALGMIGTTGIPMLLFLLSGDPLAPFTTAEIVLCVLYANTTLALRFPWACFVSGIVMVATAATVWVKPDIHAGLGAAILLNVATAVAYSLAANHRIERSERRDYLLTLRETLRVTSLTAHNDALAHLSSTDALTGLSNRRYLEAHVPELDRDLSLGRRLAVIILDVDHFKAFNDHYGHRAGDDCLRLLSAELLRVHGASADIFVRFGGEEFIVILRSRTSEDAREVAEALRRGVQSLAIPHARRPDDAEHVTISMGVAASDVCPSPSLAALIESADAALYEAKSLGRNQVRCAVCDASRRGGSPAGSLPVLDHQSLQPV